MFVGSQVTTETLSSRGALPGDVLECQRTADIYVQYLSPRIFYQAYARLVYQMLYLQSISFLVRFFSLGVTLGQSDLGEQRWAQRSIETLVNFIVAALLHVAVGVRSFCPLEGLQ